jgi:hypothetical protein
LSHTFPKVFNTVGEAETFFVANASNPAIFDADGLSDWSYWDSTDMTFHLNRSPDLADHRLACLEHPAEGRLIGEAITCRRENGGVVRAGFDRAPR